MDRMMDEELKRAFRRRTGLNLMTLDDEQYNRIWRNKGEVFRHAIMKVREYDSLAVMPTMVKETFPKAVQVLFERKTEILSIKDDETEEQRLIFLY